MAQGTITEDSYGDSVNHKLDYMIGNRAKGQLVQVGSLPGETIFAAKIPLSADISWRLALEGRIYVAADADQNDRVTGQTSFAVTTPTFTLHNPASSGVLVLPFFYQLAQTGTVAGGDIGVDTEIIAPSSFTSGTLERTRRLRIGYDNGVSGNKALLYSTVTAASSYGIAVGHATLGPDISPAEGVINIYEWQAPVGCILDPDSSMNVFTYAATTGPTWGWHFVWAELPLDWVS